ncbi:MAG: ribosome biogenesis/translation initiation ATPase RLI [Candidatus Hodarchaeales archaeon]|jgi:ATP-binding cassette subfamily E protein 1
MILIVVEATVVKKIVVIDRNKCRPGACDYVCIKVCPLVRKKRNAIKLKEKSVFPVINERICIPCGICVSRCPWRALKSVNIPGEEEEIPVHMYSDSRFRLYRLPQLNKGRVVGLLGENGIGKTTLLNLLSGNIVPNGGILSNDAFETFLANISIPGMKKYFQDLDDEGTVSYKPQVLDHLRNISKSVRESLESCNETGKIEEITEFLQIKHLLDSSYASLSGGELQRVSLAMTFLKDTKVYLVDEPATYLDVKQRLRLSKLFRQKAAEKRIVFVVEHDIAVLDYWSDIIHLLFGEPHVYGIVSRPLSVKNGINAFLLGRLADENIIFRRKRIEFKKTVIERRWDKERSIKFKPLTETLGRFTLEVKKGGEIREGEVLVVMGENGLGKTTFANIISGRSGKSIKYKNFHRRISYKPQHLSRNFDGTIEEFILQHSGRYVKTKDYRIRLLHPLGIWHLLNRPIKELSGGELQRTFIATCLAKDAELYIIDEGSAYLDARERLKITGVIRNAVKKAKRAVLAIEHDIQIAEALGDRVFLFNGKPGVYGFTTGPFQKREGMNEFLKSLEITFRRDSETGRARINKHDSKLDRYQREIGEYYYSVQP